MPKLTPKKNQERKGSGRPQGASPSGSRLSRALAAKGGSESPSKPRNEAQAPNVTQARQRLSQTAREASQRTTEPRLRKALQLKSQQALEPQERDAPLWAKALSVIDLPRAAVFSAIKEGGDIIGSGDASWDDLGRQTMEHRGVGDIEALQFSDGDAWWQRALKGGAALGGDIALDPLTYVTFGASAAATKGAAITARLGTAARVAEKGAARIGAKEVGELATKEAVDSAITRATKKGAVGLTRGEREAAGLGTLSVRLGGKAIPGTQRIAEGLSEVGAGIRGIGGGTKTATIGRKFKHAPDEIPFIEKAVGRGADDATRATAVKGLSALKSWKAGQRQLVDEIDRGLVAAYKAVQRNGVKPDDIAKLVEAGDQRALPVINWLSGIRKEAVARGVDIGDITDYHPHRITDAFRTKLADSDRLKGSFANKLDSPEAPQLMRKYRPGEEFMGQVTDGTIEDINRIARATPELGVDVFEKKSGKVLPAYAESLGRAVGKVRAGRRLEELGAATRIPSRLTAGRLPASRTELALAKKLEAAGVASGDEAAVLAQRAERQWRLPATASVPEFDRALNRLVLDDQKVAQVDNAVAAAEAPADAILQTQASIADQLSRLAEDSPLRDSLVEAQRRIGVVGEWVAANPQATPWQRRVIAMEQQAIDLEAKSLAAKGEQAGFEQIAKALQEPKLHIRYVAQADRAMADLGNGLQAEPWLVEAMTASTKMRDEKAWKELTAVWDRVQNYIKSWQVATPGFVVRNTYGGVWNNYAAYNVGPLDYKAFIRDHVKYRKAAKAGRDWTGEVDPHFAQALDAVSAAGSGQTAGEVRHGLLDRKRLNVLSAKGPYARTLRGASEDVEIFMRGALAHKVIRQGGTLDEAVQAIERIHFNYRDITDFDRAIKRVIPYWVFTSRNLPLQLDLMATHPQKFINAVRAKESIEDDSINPGEVTPNYLDDVFGGKVGRSAQGDSIFLTPDLPFVRLGEQMEDIGDAVGGDPAGLLLDDVTPLIKAPIEAKLGVQSYTGQPFEPGAQVPLWFGERWLGPAMALSGRANQTADGGWMISEKDSYLLEQYVPLLGRARRLFPNQSKYQSRVNTSWMSFFGLSVRTNTDNAQWGEIARQQKELDGWLKEQEDLGFIKPKRRRSYG